MSLPDFEPRTLYPVASASADRQRGLKLPISRASLETPRSETLVFRVTIQLEFEYTSNFGDFSTSEIVRYIKIYQVSKRLPTNSKQYSVVPILGLRQDRHNATISDVMRLPLCVCTLQ